MGFSWDYLFSCLTAGTDGADFFNHSVDVISITSAALSVFGASFVMVHFLLRSKGLFISYLIFFLALGDLVASLHILISTTWMAATQPFGFLVCTILRSIYDFAILSTLGWTGCIAVYLWMVIVQETTLFSQKSPRVRSRPLLEGRDRDHPESHNEKPRRSWFTAKILLILFCIFSWGVPLAMDIGMAAGDLYERTKAGWCHPAQPWAQLFFWDLPVAVVFVFTLVIYIWISISLRIKQTETPGAGINKLAAIVRTRTSLYIVVYLITWAPDLFSHFITYVSSCWIYWYGVIPALLTPLQGFLNCLVYSLANPDIRRQFSVWRLLLAFVLSPFLLIPALLYCACVRLGLISTISKKQSKQYIATVYGEPEEGDEEEDYIRVSDEADWEVEEEGAYVYAINK